MRHVQEYDRPNSAYMLFYERAGSGPVTATAALAEDAAPAARQAAVQPSYAAADGVAAASPQPAAGPAAPAPAASPAVAQTAAEPDDAADMVVSPQPLTRRPARSQWQPTATLQAGICRPCLQSQASCSLVLAPP